MGYKICGCEVIGNLEIDPRMNEIYKINHNPRYSFEEDIRDFNKREDLPSELYNLDILDGSPPCTTFSIAGKREETWGKEKKFKEGQKKQRLDDLCFEFMKTVEKLKPKVAIMENVEGLLLGNAKQYVQEIYSRFKKIGYKVKHWLVKGENMGIPQKRHRVIFIATRLQFDLDKIDMAFDYEPVTYGMIKEGIGYCNKDSLWYELLGHAQKGDNDLRDIRNRLGLSPIGFTSKICWEDSVLPTITAKLELYDPIERVKLSNESIRNGATFPQDYNFINNNSNNVCYVCGMSVPPIMMKRIVTRLKESEIFKKSVVK